MTLYVGLGSLPGWVAERHSGELSARLGRSLEAHAVEGGLDPVVLAVRTRTRTGDVLSLRVESVAAGGVRLATWTSSLDLHDPAVGPRGTASGRVVLVHEAEGFPVLGARVREAPAARSEGLLALAAARSRVPTPTLRALLEVARASEALAPDRAHAYELLAVVEADYPHVSAEVVATATGLLDGVASGVPVEWAVRRVTAS